MTAKPGDYVTAKTAPPVFDTRQGVYLGQNAKGEHIVRGQLELYTVYPEMTVVPDENFNIHDREFMDWIKEVRTALDGSEYKYYEPHTFGCHEALHMAMALSDTIQRNLVEHSAVVFNPAYHRLAQEAAEKLYDLYQLIGQEHMKD